MSHLQNSPSDQLAGADSQRGYRLINFGLLVSVLAGAFSSTGLLFAWL